MDHRTGLDANDHEPDDVAVSHSVSVSRVIQAPWLWANSVKNGVQMPYRNPCPPEFRTRIRIPLAPSSGTPW
jgi:hypothetical protein